MKRAALILITMFFVSATWVSAAEKSKIPAQLDASRAALDALEGKIGDNREAAAALEQARTSLKKAMEVSGKGRQLFGINNPFGDLKPEVEEEIRNYLEISDLAATTASSRLEKARAAIELEAIDKQIVNVKAKLKVFEDRKAELEKLKADAAKCQTAVKEVETLKSEKTKLTSQIELLTAERSKSEKLKSEQADLLPKIETMKTENSRLSSQIEKQLAEIKTLTTQLEEAKKAAVKATAPEKTAPPKEAPAEK